MAFADELVEAASEDRSAYRYTPVPADVDGMVRYIANLLDRRDGGLALPFVTRRVADGRVVGCTRFDNLEYWDWDGGDDQPDVAEIGGTWLAASAQRTAVNTEAKLLQFAHAFDRWHVQRLFLKTDARNERSRAAIERIGARFEGVLRNQMPAVDHPGPRDSAYFSVTPEEWPAVRSRLAARLVGG
ncbi:MAG: N-acetyltransferase [Acidimicrobiaceae bacterium]|nr:N-acetyltransferase [Acidimicrobiaceae bacterium]